MNGATARGRAHPGVRRLAEALARTGFAVVVPDLPGLRRAELTLATRRACVACALETVASPRTRGGRLALAGVSLGATVALLAAGDEELAPGVSVVAGVAPYASLVEVFRLATTGTYLGSSGLVAYEPGPLAAVVVARSLAAGLPLGRSRDLLVAETQAVPEDATDPLAAFRGRTAARLSRAGAAVVRLLANRDPVRFDELYAELPEEMRAAVAELSPLAVAARIQAPVELVSAPRDKYFPPGESAAIVRTAPRGRLTVTPALAHADLRLGARDAAGGAALLGWAARVLSAARLDPRF